MLPQLAVQPTGSVSTRPNTCRRDVWCVHRYHAARLVPSRSVHKWFLILPGRLSVNESGPAGVLKATTCGLTEGDTTIAILSSASASGGQYSCAG